jgi:hypothetical protein
MSKLLKAGAVLAAVGLAVSGCIPVAAVPLIQGGLAIAADSYCSDRAAELREGVRREVYGDPHATVLPGCE